MNRFWQKRLSISKGQSFDAFMHDNNAQGNAKSLHSTSVTVKVNSSEPMSPVCLRIRADPSLPRCESDRNFPGGGGGGGNLASSKVLSSSLESLASLSSECHLQPSAKWGQHLQAQCNGGGGGGGGGLGGNLLQMKALSSSQILPPASRGGDDVDCSTVSPVTPIQLANLIKAKDLGALLLDCRTFVCYNNNHISGALNVSCADAISRKRLSCGRTTIGELVSGPADAKDRYKQAVEDGKEFLIYDENTTDVKTLPAAHSLKVIVSCLQKDGCLVNYLLGGLQAFCKNYSQLCSQPSPTSPAQSQQSPPATPAADSGDIDSAKVSRILPHLYLGNEQDADNRELLAELGITHVLNVTSHIPLHFEMKNLKFKRLPASDSGNQNLKQYFKEAIYFIDEAEKNGGRVLVHCQAGVSRSSTIAIAYVMVRLSMTMLEAFQFVKSKRPIVAPNFNFMGQLLDFEGSLSRESAEKLNRHQRK